MGRKPQKDGDKKQDKMTHHVCLFAVLLWVSGASLSTICQEDPEEVDVPVPKRSKWWWPLFALVPRASEEHWKNLAFRE